MQNEELEIQISQITHDILDFYGLQPGVKGEKLEKLEIFMILINSHYINVLNEIENLQNNKSENIVEEILDTMNDYLESLSEEFEKIFPNNKNPFQQISFTETDYNYQTFVKSLKTWNNQEENIFVIKNTLYELENMMEKEDFEIENFLIFIQKVIKSIQLKMTVKIEDLL